MGDDRPGSLLGLPEGPNWVPLGHYSPLHLRVSNSSKANIFSLSLSITSIFLKLQFNLFKNKKMYVQVKMNYPLIKQKMYLHQPQSFH